MMLPTEKVGEYARELQNLWDDIGNNLPDDEKKSRFIRGLPHSMKTAVLLQAPATLEAAIKQAKQVELAYTMGGGMAENKTAEALAMIANQVSTLATATQDMQKKVLLVQSKPQGKYGKFPSNNYRGGLRCNNCGRLGHLKKDCKSKIKCFKCEQLGHIAKYCTNNPVSKN